MGVDISVLESFDKAIDRRLSTKRIVIKLPSSCGGGNEDLRCSVLGSVMLQVSLSGRWNLSCQDLPTMSV